MNTVLHRFAHSRPAAIGRRAAVLALALGALLPAQAQGLVDGEVRKVDKAQSRLTLKHGEIPNLDMPPMQMVFRVREARLLDGLEPGDKVRFAAEKVNGEYTVTQLQKSR